MTQNRSRNGRRWTVNECLQLQREFELLNLSIDEIASKHKRTPNAIMYKLDQEGFADYNVLYSNYNDLNSQIPTENHLSNDKDGQEENGEEEKFEDTQELADDEYVPEEDEDEEGDEEEDDLKTHVLRLEKQVMALTDMIMKSSKNKNLFTLFS